MNPTLLWLRQDLRLSDHPALHAALNRGAVIPVFIFDPEGEGAWAPGGASRWWLHHSLIALGLELEKRKSKLIIRQGHSLEEIQSLILESGADAVYWSRRHEPTIAIRDHKIENALNKQGIETRIFSSSLLFAPESIKTKTGGPYQVFTPFYRACLASPPPRLPLGCPKKIPLPDHWPSSIPVEKLKLIPKLNWADSFPEYWQPGMLGAHDVLENGINNVIENYADTRDNPNVDGTSLLSPHLHFGEISIYEVWAALEAKLVSPGMGSQARASFQAFQRQLIWREFAHHLLAHFPKTASEPLRANFQAFPWRKDALALKAWQKGLTGYPYVDAGLRQLWATGWMHNRVRMAVASFLVKDLLIPWQDGARWFWDTLVDADLAQNTLGWQWTAGCGADAAPYFRIFHPVTQGERFDPEGEYIRHWVPELKELGKPWIHRPWEAPAEALLKAGINLGASYPRPMVNHAQARERALAAYHSLSRS